MFSVCMFSHLAHTNERCKLSVFLSVPITSCKINLLKEQGEGWERFYVVTCVLHALSVYETE